MARIEYREMPNESVQKLQFKINGVGGIANTTADDVLLWFATKHSWIHQVTLYCDKIAGAAATLQLEKFAAGATGEQSGGSVVLTEPINLASGGDVTAGEVTTSDMGLAQMINDARTADYANATDTIDMDGLGASAVVTADTPVEFEPGAGIVLVTTGTPSAFIGILEILITEQVM